MPEDISVNHGQAQRGGAFIIKNASGAEIPGYSACQISNMAIDVDTGNRVFEVIKPSTDSAGHVLFIGGHKIPATLTGTTYSLPKASLDFMYGGIAVRYSGSPPAIGDEVGTASGSWTVVAGNTGFTVLGVDAVNLLVYVRPSGGGGSAVAFDVVQAIEAAGTGANAGTIGVKSIVLKSDLTASPNFVQTGSRKVVGYYSL